LGHAAAEWDDALEHHVSHLLDGHLSVDARACVNINEMRTRRVRRRPARWTGKSDPCTMVRDLGGNRDIDCGSWFEHATLFDALARHNRNKARVSQDRPRQLSPRRAKRYSKRLPNIQDKKFTFHIAKSSVYSAGKTAGLETSICFRGERFKFLREGTA
jgi:hypothetical protein